MSLKNNIIEKLYILLGESKIPQYKKDESEENLIALHFKELKVENFNNEYFKFESVEELHKTAIEYGLSPEKLLLAAIINFLTETILRLPTKEERLEIFLDLTPSFKLIYESLYKILSEENEKNFGIKIQCPDCGAIFILNEHGEYFCPKCRRVYPESEIRERCGI